MRPAERLCACRGSASTATAASQPPAPRSVASSHTQHTTHSTQHIYHTHTTHNKYNTHNHNARRYPAIIDLTRRLNRQFPTARDTQLATRGILNSLFPSWLPGAFKVMFSGPLPGFSCRLNAFATAATCQWLMGACKVNDVEIDGGQVCALA